MINTAVILHFINVDSKEGVMYIPVPRDMDPIKRASQIAKFLHEGSKAELEAIQKDFNTERIKPIWKHYVFACLFSTTAIQNIFIGNYCCVSEGALSVDNQEEENESYHELIVRLQQCIDDQRSVIERWKDLASFREKGIYSPPSNFQRIFPCYPQLLIGIEEKSDKIFIKFLKTDSLHQKYVVMDAFFIHQVKSIEIKENYLGSFNLHLHTDA